jgi:hypothetical protein
VTRIASALAASSGLVAAVALAANGPPARTAPAVQPGTPAVQPGVTAQQRGTPWSAPAVLSSCAALPAARVVFPSDSPGRATGPGAIVWSAAAGCPGGEGARVAAIGAEEEPGASATPRTAAGRPLAPRGPLLATGAPHGRIVIAGAAPGSSADGLLIQGTAGEPFAALDPPGGSSAPMALATAYLGDVALASPPAGGRSAAGEDAGGLRVHVERFFTRDFVRNVATDAAAPGPVRALTLAMDYRSEALVVWAQGGAIWAQLVAQSGGARPVERLAPADSHLVIAALLSDDRRAIVAWSDERGGETAVYIDRSAVGVHFGAPRLLERFRDPDGLPSPAASPSLVRLSSESVLLAWAGAAAGNWVVRTAPVDESGVGAVQTIAAPGGDALLADLAAGPADDALVLWTEPAPTAAGPPDMRRQALFAAHGLGAAPARTMFAASEQVAPPAPVADPAAAFDPDSDRAVAVWQSEAGAIEYSIRSSGNGA